MPSSRYRLVFPHNKLGWLSGLVEWIKSDQYPWYRRKWWAFFLSDHPLWTVYATKKHL